MTSKLSQATTIKPSHRKSDSQAGKPVTCLTASDLSLLETLEQKLVADVSVSLLAELERELLRLRCDLTNRQWEAFCSEFPKRPIFDVLRLGRVTQRRLNNDRFTLPADLLDVVMADSFKARPHSTPSPTYLISGWEYSLPVSRSIRARKAYLYREISEVMRMAIKPRILILGGGQMREADDAIHGAHLKHAEFVVLVPESNVKERLRGQYAQCPLQIEAGGWDDLAGMAPQLGAFDLIYSFSWLDSTDDVQASAWIAAGVEMLRAGGRIVAPNFAPGSRDIAWIEACWNWHPNFRSEEDLGHLVLDLKDPGIRAMIRGHAVSRDESGASAYLEIHSI